MNQRALRATIAGTRGADESRLVWLGAEVRRIDGTHRSSPESIEGSLHATAVRTPAKLCRGSRKRRHHPCSATGAERIFNLDLGRDWVLRSIFDFKPLLKDTAHHEPRNNPMSAGSFRLRCAKAGKRGLHQKQLAYFATAAGSAPWHCRLSSRAWMHVQSSHSHSVRMGCSPVGQNLTPHQTNLMLSR